MEEFRPLDQLTRENVHTLYLKAMYSLWNANGRELVDLHKWLLKYLDFSLNRRGLNPHVSTLVKVFCKECKGELRITRAWTRKERTCLATILRRQLHQWICHLLEACDSPYLYSR
jgi:hypothetical protein